MDGVINSPTATISAEAHFLYGLTILEGHPETLLEDDLQLAAERDLRSKDQELPSSSAILCLSASSVSAQHIR
jgi:hypothetical protein